MGDTKGRPSDLPPRAAADAMCRRRWLRDYQLEATCTELRDGTVYRGWQVWVEGQPIASIFFDGRHRDAHWQGSNIAYVRARYGTKPTGKRTRQRRGKVAEHTPAPWRIELPMAPGVISICAGGPIDDGTTVYVAEVSDFRVPHDPDADDERSARSLAQAWADARLIAAAPDLRAALLAFLNEHERSAWDVNKNPFFGCGCPLCTAGEAALAKARGEAQA